MTTPQVMAEMPVYSQPPEPDRVAVSPPTTDLTFFTNEPGATLLDRFRATLKYAHLFDVIVGYFRVSGFHQLYEAFEGVEKVRILVGLNLDRTSFRVIDAHRTQGAFDFASNDRARKVTRDGVAAEVEAAEDSSPVERGLRAFLDMLESGQMEIKAYPTSDLHAKVYILRNDPGVSPDFGRVITGSSNFSGHGLVAQREFNVELKDPSDVRYALDKFEVLWADAVPVTEDYVDTMRQRTWLDDSITPRELYLKFLYEYFREELRIELEGSGVYLPDGFMKLAYQDHAVASAWEMLEAYGGVFIADVVGLGKTYIAAMLTQKVLRNRPGERVLVICPPVLADYWRQTFRDFRIGDWHYEVESLGKLDRILERGTDDFGTVILDEAHRFRNEDTQSYAQLYEICFGKRVVLVSATPLNNRIGDIEALVKLFQTPKRSTIPGVPDLEQFFSTRKRRIAKLDRRDDGYIETVKEVSEEVRDAVLKHVMVRRTRTEIAKHYKADLDEQGLTFPGLAPPRRLFYQLDGETGDVFDRTIARLTAFTYARYTPLLFLKKDLTPLEQQSQRNVGGFMKGLIVKRLESSFTAFRKTLGRAIGSHERFLQMLDSGTVYVSRDVSVYDLLDSDREEELERLVEADRVKKYAASGFRDDYADRIRDDLTLLHQIRDDWETVESDPKMDRFLGALRDEKELKNQLLVFTESKETADYLFETLSAELPDQVMSYSSEGGRLGERTLNVSAARDTILAHFDPNAKKRSRGVRVLITTDVLAEGINLHHANVVVNYDLPWNPTRVLQRVGRVNRVGTTHETVYVYNFFPTDRSEEEIGFASAVKAKIQAFHDALGEDAKYLTDDEEVSTHELFGERLYRTLNDQETYEGQEDEGPSELDYLDEIRSLRDDDPDLFQRVVRLPKKARLARDGAASAAGLLTFFRRGRLKKFYWAEADQPLGREATFFEAAERFRADADERGRPMPAAYYELLPKSKQALDLLLAGEVPAAGSRRGRSNEDYVLRRLKAKEVRRNPRLTEDDAGLVRQAIRVLDDGMVPRATAKALKKAIEKEKDALRIVALVRHHVPSKVLEGDDPEHADPVAVKEVILSEYFGREPS